MDLGLTTTRLMLNMITDAVCTRSVGRSSECHINATGYVGGLIIGLPVIQTLIALSCLIDVISSSWVNRVVSRKKDEKSYGETLGYVFASLAC